MRPGDTFVGRYVLREVVGTGRGGDVWLAHDTVVGQDVALKPELVEGDRETALRRLLGEPRAMAKFRDHPHVVTLFDVVEAPGDRYWFVMEYVPGRGLDRQPPMSPERAAEIGAQLADALAALHEAGVVHCDVKPANTGLTRRGTAKLLDFGAAYRVGGAETVTANGPFSFTPDYAAPELARGQVPRPASDVFGLGATLHALVTGSPPRGTEPDDDEGLTYWKAEQGFVELDRDAVGPLHPVLTAMLQRDPRTRPDAAEAARQLRAAAAGPGPALAATGNRRRWLPVAVGAAAALALVLSLVISGDDGDASQDTGSPADPPDTRSLIGDPRTADLCALADADALAPFGEAEVDPEYRNFDSCDVLVEPDADTRIDVQIQFRPGLPPETATPSRTIGGIGVLPEPEEEDDEVCGRVLLPLDGGTDDGILVRIRVQVEDGELAAGPATLCAMADAAAVPAAEVLDRGPMRRRSPPYPETSLAWADACALLDADSLAAVPGIMVNAPEVGVANWTCKWSSTVDDLETELKFYRDEITEEYREPVSVGGHDVYVVPERNDAGTCTAFLPYRRYGDRNSSANAYEILRVYVGGLRPVPELCVMARELAASAAEELPPL
ncbi:serine/threonine protein kinase [Actinophytocola xinjiangensis]|uniref:non-specific serine/threonine protein kinase n=1 Tax=Actinophytocola xinjiangensis TaxID=485602 RepID=A0A7Z0WI16_9PSEU|nr:serine/threonine-protein kinase [Actinophytocola xinjiangensis]OLF06952.1 serine/threonine protein kinase [Actinophytocola xinjiangensis]